MHRPLDPSAGQLATLLDRLPGLVALIGPDRRYIYFNAAFAGLTGAAPGDAAHMALSHAVTAALAGATNGFRCDLAGQRIRGIIAPDVATGGALLCATQDVGRVASDTAILHQAFDNAPIGMAVVDPDGTLLRVNPAFGHMLRLSREEMVGMSFAAITHPDDIDADLELFRAVLAGERNGYQMEKRYVRLDGSIVHARLSVTAIRDRKGKAIRFVGQIEDVTEARATEARIRRGAARLALAVGAINGGFWHLDIASGDFETSEKLARFVTGQDRPQALETYVRHVHPEDMHAADLSPLTEGRVDSLTTEYRLQTPKGLRWVRCDRRLVRSAAGAPEQVVGVVIDITGERERRRIAEVEAETDGLTGLLNRRGAQRGVAAFDRSKPCGIIAIDLDLFKQVNDRFGHQAGDTVLRECARRLREELRTSDVIARLGGDEFLIVMPGAAPATMAPVAARLSAAIARPLRDGDSLLTVGASVGHAWAAQVPADIAPLIAEADRMLYRDKAARRDTRRRRA